MAESRPMIAKSLLVPALLGVVLCAFFHRALSGERFYAVDFYQTFVPLRSILAEAWSHGFPTWTGRIGNGSPVLANPAYGVLYLPNLLYLGTDPARWMTLLTVAHFIFGGIGTWMLARRWEMSRAAAWVAAIGFVMGGPAVSSIAYPNLSWPLGWMPWAIVAHEESAHGRIVRGTVGLALAWFSMFSTGDPVVLLAAIAGSALSLSRDVLRAPAGRRWTEARSLVRGPAVAALLAIASASPLIVAAARYLPSSVRGAGFKPAGIVLWSLHPLLLVGTMLLHPFGDPALTGLPGFWARAIEHEHPRPLLAGLYVGGLIVSLAILGALRLRPRRVMLLAWLGLLVLLALGKYGPIYPLVGGRLGFDALRYPTKWIVPAMLPLALLAASGLEALGESASATAISRRGALVFLAVLALLGLVSVGSMAGLDSKLASLAGQPNFEIDGIPFGLYVRTAWLSATARSAVPLALALAAIAFGSRARARVPTLAIIAALATLDVALANSPLASTVTRDFYDVPRAAAAILGDPAGHGRVYVEDFDTDSSGLRFAPIPRWEKDAARTHHDRLTSYVGAAAGLNLAFNADTEAFSPITYARADVLIVSAALREKLMFLGAAGATHIVTFRPPEGALHDPMASIPVGFNRPLFVYRNPFATPRARIVSRLTPYDSDAGFIRVVQSSPDDLFAHTALVEQRELLAAGLPSKGSSAEGGTATIVSEDGSSLGVQVDGPGGFLVVSDALAPGWTARLDGKPAPLLRADLAFRAVPVPAGRHRVEMHYNPW